MILFSFILCKHERCDKLKEFIKEFIIVDLKPAIKFDIEGKLITDVNHAVSDVKVTVLAELLKCKSEIYEMKESQLRLGQQVLTQVNLQKSYLKLGIIFF